MKWSRFAVVTLPTAFIRRIIYSRWFGAALLVCLVLGTVLWFVALEELPSTISIATGARNGQYYLCGDLIARNMERRTDHSVKLLVTDGSVDNQQRIAAGTADLAIIQHGAVPLPGLAVIAPLFDDVVHVVVRTGRNIGSIEDLAGKNVVLGPAGSGMRASALDILEHYGVDPETLGDKTGS